MTDTRERIVEAMFALLADRPYEEVTLRAIAEEAGLSLAEVAAEFSSRGAIIAAFVRRIDQEALAHDVSDMADEPPRERLFDVLMSRIEALRDYRGALAQLMRAVRVDPQLAMGLNALAVRSQGLMLAAAGIAPSGWQGRIATQGLAISFAKVLRTFVDEEEPGLPRTMAALDRELRAGEKRYNRLSRVIGDGVRDELRTAGRGRSDGFADGPPANGAAAWMDAETLAPDPADGFAATTANDDRVVPDPAATAAPASDPAPLPGAEPPTAEPPSAAGSGPDLGREGAAPFPDPADTEPERDRADPPGVGDRGTGGPNVP